MYTVDDNNKYENEYDEEYTETSNGSFWDNNKGIIIKVLIILACLAILIWLILALKKNNKNNNVVIDPTIHSENVEKVRLAAEKYFFLDKNMPTENGTRDVTVKTLQTNGYVDAVVDGNNKVCSDTNSYATLSDTKTSYVLTIHLACSTNEKEETYNYSKTNYACLNCDGSTYMNGKTDVDPSKDDSKKDDKDSKEEDGTDYSKYSCNNWSNWSTKRISDPMLEERTRVVVKGVKYGKKEEVITYGPWSDYVETPIVETPNMEVEKTSTINKVWSENKVSSDKITESATVKLISTEKINNGTYSYCPKGYTKKDGKCYSERIIGDLTYLQYNSGNYLIYNRPCEAVHTEKDSNGKYVFMYKNCQYSNITSLKTGTSTTKLYTYQELIDQEVTMYRARAKYTNVIETPESYTDTYYEESKLPSGYVKLSGSERTEYSYRISVCEK